jgi:protein-S-isoprenylcysteine O-methyltransferase Ste14
VKRFIPVTFSLVLTAACLFSSAGRLAWPNAWALLTLNFIASLASTVVMSRNPELLAERSNVKAGKSWDKALIGIGVLLGPMAIWITAGLEARFHPSVFAPIPLAVGFVAALLAAFLVTWSMRANRFFSAIVRIQTERGHTVVQAGPYRFIRHPGYAGMSAVSLLTPLILNSWWALLPAAVTVCANVLRTLLEDRTLHNELPGYADYAAKVKCRLIPFIW